MSDNAAAVKDVIEAVHEALSHVNDPEIRRPITELGMVDTVEVDGGRLSLKILLTVAGCPMRDTLQRDIAGAVDGV
ncbi:iron-sulfur cluster assembly protein, partial [Glycomyces rutgersensis]